MVCHFYISESKSARWPWWWWQLLGTLDWLLTVVTLSLEINMTRVHNPALLGCELPLSPASAPYVFSPGIDGARIADALPDVLRHSPCSIWFTTQLKSHLLALPLAVLAKGLMFFLQVSASSKIKWLVGKFWNAGWVLMKSVLKTLAQTWKVRV